MATQHPDLLDPDFEPTDEQLESLMRGFIERVRAKAAGGYDTGRMHVLDGLKPVERPEHMKRWADEFLSPPLAVRVEDLPESVVERIERLADAYPNVEPEIFGDCTAH